MGVVIRFNDGEQLLVTFDLEPVYGPYEVHKLPGCNILHVCAYGHIYKERSSSFHQSLREGP